MSKKKQLNQHFTSQAMAEKLLSMLPPDTLFMAKVLEPSCGDGQLVKALLEHDIHSVIAIDIDPDLVFDLDFEFADDDRVVVVQEDFLKK